MSGQKKRRHGKRSHGPWAAAAQRRQRMFIMVGSVAAGLIGVSVMANVGRAEVPHPDPRTASEQPRLMPATRYEGYPRVSRTYEMAAATPMILDGLYCYCHCSEHSGHYSLLDCFSSDHAARCDVCMSEAVIGHDMGAKGASLQAIRAEIDRTFGT